jgi:hypothetical protein
MSNNVRGVTLTVFQGRVWGAAASTGKLPYLQHGGASAAAHRHAGEAKGWPTLHSRSHRTCLARGNSRPQSAPRAVGAVVIGCHITADGN